MQLDRVEIRNYRSIQNLTIKFDKNCIILVGANESGKSNILKALSLLKNDVTSTIDDVRDPLPDENQDAEKYVRFIFKLDEREIDDLYEYTIKLFYGINESESFMKNQKKSYSFKSFCKIKNEGLYIVNLETTNKRLSHWSLIDFNLSGAIKKLVFPPGTTPTAINLKDEVIALNKYKYINIESIKDISSTFITDSTAVEINQEFGIFIQELVLRELPKTIFWEYNDKNLLPGRIELAQFKENADTSIPLKNMFLLAGINNIKKTITEAESKKNGMRNMLNKVATITSKHINSAWKETKDISLSLAQNGNFIEAGIQDTYNVYDFARRSEGFKRFVTFLLMISAEDRNQNLSNALILIDEPDLGLHPSGIRNLREELLKISEHNKVVISTHSINMIDKENIDIHKIVKKQNEITIMNETKNSELTDEEVLYNALGFSLFEMLNENNIIFEGWRDKEFFRKCLNKFKAQNEFNHFGFCHAAGTKDIEAKSGLIELLGREFLIVSDSDKPAIEKKKSSGYKHKWLMYSDICGNEYETMEDFINYEYLLKKFTITLKNHEQNESLNFTMNHAKPVMEQFKNSLLSQGLTKDLIGIILNNFKEISLKDLKAKDIKDEYQKIISKILKLKK